MLQIDKGKLNILFQDFFVLTNIHICLFDENFNEVARYPEKYCDFCALVRKNEDIDIRCKENDRVAFQKCIATKSRYTYRCHMDLVETAIPILFEQAIIGYMMIGQVADRYSVFEHISPKIDGIANNKKAARKYYEQLPHISNEKIGAAAHIADACASYLYVSKLIKSQSENMMHRINKYIESHLLEQITIKMLCREFYVSRVELYNIFHNMFRESVANHIKNMRIDCAKKLLTETDYPINKIAAKCGIPDYNYFSKVFKRTCGISAIKYRKNEKLHKQAPI